MADPDGDGLGNLDEFRAGTNPLNPDTDGGGCWDGWEVSYGLDPTLSDDDGWDSDGDWWSNYREFLEGTDPTNANTDQDGFPWDSTDPHPLIPDDEWRNTPGGIGGGSGGTSGTCPDNGPPNRFQPPEPPEGPGEPSGLIGMGETPIGCQSGYPGGSSGIGNWRGSEVGNSYGHGQSIGMPESGHGRTNGGDSDHDGLVEFISSL